MTPITIFAGRAVAVFGLGGSGMATAQALKAGGAQPIVWDDSAAKVEEARTLGLEAANLEGLDWKNLAALVLSPGVPLTHPAPHWTVQLAAEAHVPVIGDIELFARQRRASAPDAPFVAITGTNGKSTTTALIAHILKAAGHDVQLGGNIGTAILSLEPPAPWRTHVIECSSFQIDLSPTLDPTVGVFLNLTEDHLDRHGTMAQYGAIKTRLVAQAGTAVLGVDDGYTQAAADHLEAGGRRVVRVSAIRPLSDGVYAAGETIVLAQAGASRVVASLGAIGSLRGAHNAQNACAAFAAVHALGVAPETIAAALRSFPGLAHRMEEVRRIGETLFINDSKATNADAAAKALASFDRIHWIIGGKSKTGGIESLRGFFPKIAHAYLIGAAAEEFAETLGDAVPFTRSGTIDQAVRDAAEGAATTGGVVLLSPACASYDQFKNFEERGKAFKDAVLAL